MFYTIFRNEDNVLIKHKPGRRSVTFSKEPVRIEYAAPRTFTRNYIKSNHKKKKEKSAEIHSDGLYMLMNNPEILQRLDNANESVKPADQSTPDSDLSVKVNLHDQIKINYYKPPSAGSYVPASSVKDGSDGESNSSGGSSEENVYVFGQAEHDEECLNILSNGLDDDDEDDNFFTKSNPLKETNIDEVIFSAKMTEVIENSSPKKFKETSLIDPPPPPVITDDQEPEKLLLPAEENEKETSPIPHATESETVSIPATNEESEESEESSSMGSVDSGIHEAGTDHDSPVEERLPEAPPKLTQPLKPVTPVSELPKASSHHLATVSPVPTKPNDEIKPPVVAKPQVTAKPPVVSKPSLTGKPQITPKPQVATKPLTAAKPQLQVPAQPRWQRQVPVLSAKPLQQVSPQLQAEEESESESEESETSSVSSDDRPPSPHGHEMTYLQYDEEPMLPKYKKEIQVEKTDEAQHILPGSPSSNRSNLSPLDSAHMRNTTFIPDPIPHQPTPEIPRTSLENFFGPNTMSAPIGAGRDSRRDSRRDSQLLERHEMEQQQIREAQRLKQMEQRVKELQIQQEIETQKLAEIQAKQHFQRQLDIKRQQELQLRIEREQLEELQRHRELQQIQEMQRLELLQIQEEERRRDEEARREHQRQLEERKLEEAKLERERLRVEQERQAKLEKQRLEQMEKMQQEQEEMREKQRQMQLLAQIDAEKEKQFEEERQLEAEKKAAAQAQLNADFEDIDSLLEGLMEMDPIISRQKQDQQQQKLRQLGLYLSYRILKIVDLNNHPKTVLILTFLLLSVHSKLYAYILRFYRRGVEKKPTTGIRRKE